MDQQQSTLFSTNLDSQNVYTLRSLASWAKVLGVVGIILGAIFFLAGIAIQQAASRARYSYGGYGRRDISMIGNIGMATYVILAIIMVVTSIFALNAGNRIVRGLQTNDSMSLASGFANVRNYFAVWAILLMLSLLVMLLSIVSSL
ncbi:MAG: hypothetical protein RJA57_71 [Bacteroidota bacterium]|jgi:uncharacterized membrane protein YjgN (DUF898 family)